MLLTQPEKNFWIQREVISRTEVQEQARYMKQQDLWLRRKACPYIKDSFLTGLKRTVKF